MDLGANEQPTQDVGIELLSAGPPARPVAARAPNWRALVAVGVAVVALVGVYALGRSGASSEQASPMEPTATAVPEPELIDFLGEGFLLADFDLGDGSRAIIWCRESVPGTKISSTLALIHVASSPRFGDQVVLYEELTKPWIFGGSQRRGRVLETEGLGVGNFAASAPLETDAELAEPSDGTRCESCAPEQVTLGGEEVLVGSCIHGLPFGAGLVYAIAPPAWPGQTPLALHVSCGITTVRLQGDRILVEAEVPLVRGLHEARFPLPAVRFERVDGRFVASDLELLDWNCEVQRSSHLAGEHLLRTEAERSISYELSESAIGEIGIHGPMVLGLTAEQCSLLTRAWWGQPDLDDPTGDPISSLVGLEPPPGESDWFYGCHRG